MFLSEKGENKDTLERTATVKSFMSKRVEMSFEFMV